MATDRGLMYASQKGTPVNSKSLYHRSFKPLLKRAGLPDVVFYELWYTYATIRFMKGQYLIRVSKFLGYSTITMTLDRYSHVIPGLSSGDVIENALS